MPFCELRYFSPALGLQTSANILLPDSYVAEPWRPVMLLHGLSDDHTIWARRTSLERYLEGTPWMVVMPNGGRGFYTDAEVGFRYGTAIGEELPNLIERTFRVDGPWAVQGLSMGGYGALRLALAYPERFRSAVSHSGALDFGHTAERYPDDARLEEFQRITGAEPKGSDHDLYHLVKRLSHAQRPALRIDCGEEDFLIECNRAYTKFLTDEGIDHEYEEHPGAHTWEYWDEHVMEGFAFHHRNLA